MLTHRERPRTQRVAMVAAGVFAALALVLGGILAAVLTRPQAHPGAGSSLDAVAGPQPANDEHLFNDYHRNR